MHSTEQAAFEALVSELDAALACLGELPVRDNPSFFVEPDWFPEVWCVRAERDGAAGLRFMLEGHWIRVDVAGLAESLQMPLPNDDSRLAQKHPSFLETLTRLLTSKANVRYRRRTRVRAAVSARYMSAVATRSSA